MVWSCFEKFQIAFNVKIGKISVVFHDYIKAALYTTLHLSSMGKICKLAEVFMQ